MRYAHPSSDPVVNVSAFLKQKEAECLRVCVPKGSSQHPHFFTWSSVIDILGRWLQLGLFVYLVS